MALRKAARSSLGRCSRWVDCLKKPRQARSSNKALTWSYTGLSFSTAGCFPVMACGLIPLWTKPVSPQVPVALCCCHSPVAVLLRLPDQVRANGMICCWRQIASRLLILNMMQALWESILMLELISKHCRGDCLFYHQDSKTLKRSLQHEYHITIFAEDGCCQ